MKIKSIQLKHTLHFTDLHAEFNYHDLPITLILGEQCSGKTSILRFSYQALTWFAARYKDLRTAGVVMLDQDILLNRLQSKIDVQIEFPEEIGSFAETADLKDTDLQKCSWQLYKTLNSQGVGISKVETQQLEDMVLLYQRALRNDPLLGLPLIAYYPAERFVNEINLLNKNNPAIFQAPYAYEISAIPFTTFTRFFEWFREISDIENAQSAQLIQHILEKNQQKNTLNDTSHYLEQKIIQAHTELYAPALGALRQAVQTVIPEISNIWLQYQPKLQMMVNCQGQIMMFQQLSNSMRNLLALVGDIVRRMCLLNPSSLYPCQEGDGILMIDAIDHQLDQNMSQAILSRFHQAFPRLQILATGSRPELLEQASRFQCLQLEHQQLHSIEPERWQQEYEKIYAALHLETDTGSTEESPLPKLQDITAENTKVQAVYLQIQEQLDEHQRLELIQMLQGNDTAPDHQPSP
ncbi:ATP-binding protein [Acinetobacter tianfuensis]|uniref:ATP-binding protein n=1 Tax=Acinetobacter tianfuensis TaxID=2419603 RepID=A0A3A8EH77_9GAMM|nr:AAA family ATPase [Acinetobacter tianfuensis]RKG33468.1 ATP-binding protein [Acinetobacter tianfuensis]